MPPVRYPHIRWTFPPDVDETWVTALHPVDGHEFGLRYPNDGWNGPKELAAVRREVTAAIHQYVVDYPEGKANAT